MEVWIHRNFAIRTGCYIEWMLDDILMKGVVISHVYLERGHIFTVRLRNGRIYKVSGACLYRNQVQHIPGKESRQAKKEQLKTKRRLKKRLRRERNSRGRPGKRGW